MKRSLLIFIFIVALIGGAVTGYFSLPLIKADDKKPGFVFGIHMNAYPANTVGDPYQPANVDAALALAKNLGVSHLRINLEYYGYKPFDQVNDDLIAKVVKAGFEPVLIIESPLSTDQFFQKETYQSGFDLGFKVASRYKNSVNYYQLANEVSGMTIKPNYPGYRFSDYDPQKYELLKNWLKGLSDGISDADLNGKRIVSSNWLGTAVIDQLIADQVNFEIIGWDWFSDMGTDPTHKILDDGSILDIPGHFANSGKKFWFVELNRSGGSYKNQEEAQANYLRAFWENVKDSPYVQGIFGFTLADIAPHVPESDRGWGFVTIKPVPGTGRFSLGNPKPIFEQYKQIIKRSKSRLPILGL